MKLRNKKTGEIRPAEVREDGIYLYDKNYEQWYKYELDTLGEWWEYYEERFYYIDADGYIKSQSVNDKDFNNVKDGIENLKAIGNYFETIEEAEKKLEKINAWQRLENKGFKFTGWKHDVTNQKYIITMEEKGFEEWAVGRKKEDLDLLFGGEE